MPPWICLNLDDRTILSAFGGGLKEEGRESSDDDCMSGVGDFPIGVGDFPTGVGDFPTGVGDFSVGVTVVGVDVLFSGDFVPFCLECELDWCLVLVRLLGSRLTFATCM